MTEKKVIHSLQEFTEWIKEKKSSDDQTLLYRGLSSECHKLDASIVRSMGNPTLPGIWKKTINLIDKARKKGRGALTERTDFELLAIIQHHDSGTPLIDFTSDSSVALCFACEGNPKKNGKIIIVAPTDNKFRSINIQNNYISPNGIADRKKEKSNWDGLWRYTPFILNSRMVRQKSEFIIGKMALDTNDIFATCIIAQENKKEILQTLKNISDTSWQKLFLDIPSKEKTNIYIPETEKIPSATKRNIAEAYNNLGIAYYTNRDYDNAIANYDKAIELKSNFAEAYNNLGTVYGNKSNYNKAIANYKKAIKLNPDYADAYNNRGNVYFKKRDYRKAIANHDKAIELNPNFAQAYSNRGNAYGSKGSHEEALADYNKAIKLNPNDAVAHYNRGITYSEKGDVGKAITNYDKAIELNPDLSEAYTNRGNAYDRKGDYKRAIADYDKIIELNPNNAELHYNRGVTHSKNGDYDNAIADYNRAIKLNPNDIDTYNSRGIAYGRKGNYGNAITNFNKAIKLNPNDAKAYNNLGIAYYHKDKYNKAITNLNKAIELDPNDAMSYFNRGSAYRDKGENDNAIADFSKAIELNPKLAEAYNNRGFVYNKKGEYNKALTDLNKAIKRNPKLAEAYYNRSIAHAKKKTPNYKAAKENLQHALKMAKEQGNNPLADHIQNLISTFPDTRPPAPDPPAPDPPTSAPPTPDQKKLTRNDLAETLSPCFVTAKEAYNFVGVFFDTLRDEIAEHDEVKIHGFGIFRCLNKTARVGRNLRTGKNADISARRVVSFVASGKFKKEIMAAGEDKI